MAVSPNSAGPRHFFQNLWNKIPGTKKYQTPQWREKQRTLSFAERAPRLRTIKFDDVAPMTLLDQLCEHPELRITEANQGEALETLQNPQLRAAVIAHLFVLNTLKEARTTMHELNEEMNQASTFPLEKFGPEHIDIEMKMEMDPTIIQIREILFNPYAHPFETNGQKSINFFDRDSFITELEDESDPEMVELSGDDTNSVSSEDSVPSFEALTAQFEALKASHPKQDHIINLEPDDSASQTDDGVPSFEELTAQFEALRRRDQQEEKTPEAQPKVQPQPKQSTTTQKTFPVITNPFSTPSQSPLLFDPFSPPVPSILLFA